MLSYTSVEYHVVIKQCHFCTKWKDRRNVSLNKHYTLLNVIHCAELLGC